MLHISTIALLLLLLSFTSAFAADTEVKPLTVVSIENNPPFTYTLPDGSLTGLYIEMWELWSETTGIPINQIILPFEQSIQLVKDGKAVHSGLFVNENRLKWADFSSPIHRVETGVIYNRNFDSDMKLADMTEIIVGVQEGSFQDQYLSKNYPNLTRFQYNSTSNVLDKLLSGEVNAVVGEIPFLRTQLDRLGLQSFSFSEEILLTNTTHATLAKGQEKLLETIDSGWSSIPTKELVQLEQKWLPYLKPFFSGNGGFDELTSLEQLWLATNSNFTLGIEHNDFPYEFLTDDNIHSGLVADYIAVIKERLNINFNLMTQYQWKEAFQLLQQGEIDLMAGVVISEQRAATINFSNPYFSMPIVIVTKQGNIYPNSIEDLESLKVGVIGGYSLNDYLVSIDTAFEIIAVDSDLNGLLMLENNEIDAYVGGLQVLNKVIQDNELFDLQISTVLDISQDYAVAVRKGLEPLVPIINKVIDNMSQKERLDINNNWLSIQINEGLSLIVIILWVLPIAGVLVGITLYVVYSNRRLSREIEQRRRIQSELEQATKNAEKANKAKSEFLANMSHEIRTPMNAVLGMCQVLRDTSLSDEQQKNLDVIHSSSDTLLMLINDILDLSKIESGKLSLEDSPYQLQQVLSHLESQIVLLINNRQVEFNIHVADDVPIMMSGDRLRLGQILLNLCNNAAKFTHHGNIDLSISLDKIERDDVVVRFAVKDTGIGMSGLQMNKLFKTYSQGDSSISRQYGGTGLGLTITKHLVELMQGEIYVESEIDVGSTFTFYVVQRQVEASVASEDELQDIPKAEQDMESYKRRLEGKHVLVVDDNKVNLMVADKLLTKAGIIVTTAEDGQTAVDACDAKDFDAVLMDLQMPILDGYAATILIRKQPKNVNLPIIALSANVMQADIDRCYQVGMNSHMPKPLDIHKILRALVHYISTTE